MKTLLLNDTSHYHSGCAKVVEVATKHFKVTDVERLNAVGELTKNIDFNQFDRVILNGEGTMHHRSPHARIYMSALRKAQIAGCKTFIVNTVWQEFDHSFDDVLKKCDYVSVREIYSQNEMAKKYGVTPEVRPDLSYFALVPYQEYPYVAIYEGQCWTTAATHRPTPSKYKCPRINIFVQPWHVIVNRLRHCDVFITGRHHEMYAACKAKCRFLVKSGNTWKNEGLLASAEVEIPFDIKGVQSGKYDAQYQKLWKYLDSFGPPSLGQFMKVE